MACGLPIVGSDVGGIKDYIVNGKTGFLVDPYNIEDIFDKLDLLSKDKLLVKKMGGDAFQWVLNNYSWDTLIEKYIDVFNRSIN